MRIRARVAGAIAGTAFAGLAALAVGTAAPAGAQQPVKAASHSVSVAPQSCWDDDCGWGDDWGDDDWGGGGWDSWSYSSW
ncbi:hypothetical protein [Actinomadura sp. DC4]|uniref:hypothetical protein n=1 Tax=Actinomadura sp. DC4 TaxID=3055069 RepID=UPI0025AFE457|nr:hypothetical protein [Actinomadura sp. DC4]MDN3352830.1 hypothetical protein [Actinomadura sp. DC4]